MGVLRKIVLVICLIVFVGSAGILGMYLYDSYKAQNELTGLLDMTGEDIETEQGTIIGKYASIWRANNDLIGWIKIDGTKVDFPVMQTKENPEFYLRRDFHGEYSTPGVPFMDAESDIFIPTSNFLIYGHNMRNGTMFHDVVKYKDEAFYQKHKTFNFDTIYKGGQGEYAILAAGYSKIYHTSDEVFKYYQCAGITTEEEFNAYVEGVKEISEYDTGVTAEFGDQLVTLSTCTNVNENGRFFIVGVRTDAKARPPQH